MYTSIPTRASMSHSLISVLLLYLETSAITFSAAAVSPHLLYAVPADQSSQSLRLPSNVSSIFTYRKLIAQIRLYRHRVAQPSTSRKTFRRAEKSPEKPPRLVFLESGILSLSFPARPPSRSAAAGSSIARNVEATSSRRISSRRQCRRRRRLRRGFARTQLAEIDDVCVCQNP